MELNEMTGFYSGNPTTIRLPVRRIIKQELLNLVYSSLEDFTNKEAADQLAEHFGLDEKQRTAAREDGANFWRMEVNWSIQALVVAQC